MVVDLIMLVIISSAFFLFLSSLDVNSSIDAATIRSQGAYTQRLLFSLLNYQTENGTIAELVGAEYCIQDTDSLINSSVHSAMAGLDVRRSNFIFLYGDTKAVYNNLSCVRTERINLATFDLSLPCQDNVVLSLGYWPKTQEVEPC
jgi:hypothetical protein